MFGITQMFTRLSGNELPSSKVTQDLNFNYMSTVQFLILLLFAFNLLTYYVFHGRVTLFFTNNSLTQCRITMKFLHNFF